MNKQKLLGITRTLLTSAAGILVALGHDDGHGWQPAIGIGLGLTSLGWGLWNHRKSGKAISFSLIRKTVNATGAGLATYGIMNPGSAEAVASFTAGLGPLVAGIWSAIENDDSDDPPAYPNRPFRMVPFLLVAASALMLFPSCASLQGITAKLGAEIDSDGCVLATYTQGEHKYLGGPCIDDLGIAAYRLQWKNEDGISLRATRIEASGETKIEYLYGRDWVAWSSKSGVSIGRAPISIP